MAFLSLRRHASTVTVALVVSGCQIGSYEQSVSNPKANDVAAKYVMSETSVAYVPPNSVSPKGVVLVGYNDFSGVFESFGSFLRPHPSGSGLSYSTDFGQSWTRYGPLAIDPTCDVASPDCLKGLFGDPWITTDGIAVYYSSLGSTKFVGSGASKGLYLNALAVAVSLGGLSWSYPVVAAKTLVDCDPNGPGGLDACDIIDKPSISAAQGTVVAAFLDGKGTDVLGLRLATSDTFGSWTANFPQTASPAPPTLCAGCSFQNPVVKLTDRLHGYLAYIEQPIDLSASAYLYNIRVVRIDRAYVGAEWTERLVYRRDKLEIEGSAIAANASTWRDAIPVSFDVGNGGTHLYLAFRRNVVRERDLVKVSQVFVDDCRLTSPAGIDCRYDPSVATPNVGWRTRGLYSLAQTYTGHQLQPGVRASATDEDVAITWYQQASAGFPGANGTLPSLPDPRLTVYAAYSTTGVDGIRSPFDLTTSLQLPCPIRTSSYWGDYFGSVIIPGRSYTAERTLGGIDTGPETTPWIVTAHSDSHGGCTQSAPLPYLVNDHHVEGVVW